MGPLVVFNLKIESFYIMLRSLTESGLLVAELLGGLDNIKLYNSFKADDLLKVLLKRL